MNYIIDTIFDISAAMAMVSLTLLLVGLCGVVLLFFWELVRGH